MICCQVILVNRIRVLGKKKKYYLILKSMVRFNKELSITRSSPMKVFHEDELHTAI